MNAMRTHRFCLPQKTLFGWGCVNELGEELQGLQVDKCLLVTDKYMVEAGLASVVIEILSQKNISAALFSDVTPDPDTEQVQAGVELYLANGCNGIISLGGGSPHDCAKGIKLAIICGKFDQKKVPLAAITTTAGTGSETTRVSVITNQKDHMKMVLADDKMMPDIAVDDPSLMKSMPPGLTAATGMDALTHAIEAYVAREKNPFSDCTSLKAVQLIDRFLVRAYNQGGDNEAREGMAYAQYLAGMAFSNSGLGIVHALAHSLGGLYGIPHGVACAVMLPYGIAANQDAACSYYAEIYWAIMAGEDFLPEKQAMRLLINYLLDFNRQLAMPKNLSELNVNPGDFERLAEMAYQDITLPSNPSSFSVDEIKQIFKNAYQGNL